ncbi:hypothetical protein ACFV16_33160, partial [Streptomyces massasporeus]
MTGDSSRVRTAPRTGSRNGRDAARPAAVDRGRAELERGRRQLFDGPVGDARETLLLAASLLAADAPETAEAAHLAAADAAWAAGDVVACLTTLDGTDVSGPAEDHAAVTFIAVEGGASTAVGGGASATGEDGAASKPRGTEGPPSPGAPRGTDAALPSDVRRVADGLPSPGTAPGPDTPPSPGAPRAAEAALPSDVRRVADGLPSPGAAPGPDAPPSPGVPRGPVAPPWPGVTNLTLAPAEAGPPEQPAPGPGPGGWVRDPFFQDYRDGMRALLARQPEHAAGPLRRVLDRARRDDRPERLLRAAAAALLLGDVHAARTAGARALAAARTTECAAFEARALEYLAYGELRAGRHAQARPPPRGGGAAAPTRRPPPNPPPPPPQRRRPPPPLRFLPQPMSPVRV